MVPAAGGVARKVTSLATEAGGVLWIDDGTLLVTSDVYPDCDAHERAAFDDACQKKRLDEAGKPSSARVYDRLLYPPLGHLGRRPAHATCSWCPLDGGAARAT